MRDSRVEGEDAVNRFDHYSNDARKSLAQAREIALRLNHKTIDTEHLLYGMLDSGDPVIHGILGTLGINAVSCGRRWTSSSARAAARCWSSRSSAPPPGRRSTSPSRRPRLTASSRSAPTTC